MSEKTLTEQARELAQKLLREDYHGGDQKAICTRIEEVVNCSSSTAYRGYRDAKKGLTTKAEVGVKPEFKVIDEKKKEPEFIEPPTPPSPIEEIETPEPTEVPEEIQAFKEMMRGTHILFFSKEGLLGEKYGHSKDVCVHTSDQFYFWLVRRYGVEALEKWDTVFVVMAYGNLIGTPIIKYVRERQRKAEKEAKKKKPEEKKPKES